MAAPVQGLWIGPKLSTMERLSICSFLKNGHQYHLYVYRDVGGVPSGTFILNANEILPDSMIFQYRDHESYAGFSDFFRYKLLLEKGGWWVDLDVVCTRHFSFDSEYVFATEQCPSGRQIATSGIICAPQGAKIMNYMWDVCRKKDPRTLAWGDVGPALIKAAIEKFMLDHYVRPSATFCPVAPHRWLDVILPGRIPEIGEDTYAVHLWNEMWRGSGLDKDETYAPRCLYERLKGRFLT